MCISGRYEGLSTSPAAGDERLDLRVDVDAHGPHAIVTNRISGDLFGVAAPGDVDDPERLYRGSWIVDTVTRSNSGTSIALTGPVRFYPDKTATGSLRIVLSAADPLTSPAIVDLTAASGTVTSYSCLWKGPAFREVRLELDFCRTVGRLRLPQYDLGSHPVRPDTLVGRTMTLESALGEAGVRATVVFDPDDVDDSAKDPQNWSERELHDALVTHFEDAKSEWPRWSLWGLLAGASNGDAGLMFDLASPQRQGFAIFHSHPWFSGLPDGDTGANETEIAALRTYLFAWVHEIGHAFNMAHSWDKRRSKALSWMNYPGRFNSLPGGGNFWKVFPFVFDEPELIHIRHGNRAAVIMGGDPMSGDGHLGSDHLDLEMFDPSMDPPADATLDLRLQAAGVIELMTPVTVEVRLRNRSKSDVVVASRMSPQDGNLVVYIKPPNGTVTAYEPLSCRLRESEPLTLHGETDQEPFDDRHSTEVDITYGRDGFYFSDPGQYELRAVYVAADDRLVRSNLTVVRVERPRSADLEKLTKDFFTSDVGQVLYLKGSPSPHLTKGANLLRDVVERRRKLATSVEAYALGDARLMASIADGIAAPFFRLKQHAVRRLQKGDPDEALKLTEDAATLLRQFGSPLVNLTHARLGEARARWKQIIGDADGAKSEIESLRSALKSRGVHERILKRLRT